MQFDIHENAAHCIASWYMWMIIETKNDNWYLTNDGWFVLNCVISFYELGIIIQIIGQVSRIESISEISMVRTIVCNKILFACET